MNNNSENQTSTENKTEGTANELSDLGKITVNSAVLKLEACLQNLKHSHQEALCLNRISDTQGILQKCCQNLQTLIQLEIDAADLRKQFDEKTKENS